MTVSYMVQSSAAIVRLRTRIKLQCILNQYLISWTLNACSTRFSFRFFSKNFNVFVHFERSKRSNSCKNYLATIEPKFDELEVAVVFTRWCAHYNILPSTESSAVICDIDSMHIVSILIVETRAWYTPAYVSTIYNREPRAIKQTTKLRKNTT